MQHTECRLERRGVLQMKHRTRIHYSESQKALMWDRWRRGESLQQIAQLFDRNHSSVQRILALSGGIRPPERRRSTRALSLGEREEISRGIAAGQSMRTIAVALGRAPSTVSRELRRKATAPVRPIWRHGIGLGAPSPVSWPCTGPWRDTSRSSSSGSGHRSRWPAGSGTRIPAT